MKYTKTLPSNGFSSIKETEVGMKDEKNNQSRGYRYREPHEMKDSGVEWLGMIPKEWEKKPLKSLTNKITSGSTPKGGSEIYLDEGIPFLRSQNVHFGELRLKDVAHISENTHKEMKRSQILINDVLINITGASIGRVATVPKNFNKGNLNQHVCIIRVTKKLNNKYLFYYLSSEKGQLQVFINQVGTSREGLTFEELKNFKIIMPSLTIQQKIVNFLNEKTAEFDSVIEKKEKLIEKLEEAKKSLISEVVTGKKRIFRTPPSPSSNQEGVKSEWKVENREPHEIKDSGVEWLGMIPKEWGVTKLKYVSYLTMGQSPESSSVNEKKEGLPFFQGKTEFGKMNPIAKVYCNIPKKISNIGEILISVRAPVGDLNITNQKCCIGRGLASIKALNHKMYLYNLLNYAKDKLKSYATGSTFEAISTEQLKNLKVVNPSDIEQQQIANFLDQKITKFDSIIQKNKIQIEKIKEAKQSLISEAVTGKIEVL